MRVLLIHGLYMNRLALLPLAHRLRSAGYAVQTVGVRTVFSHLDVEADRVAGVVRDAGDERAALIGHSLGGLIAARCLMRHPTLPVTDLMLLGSPYAGSRVARRLRALPAVRHLVGRPLREWLAQAPHDRPPCVRIFRLAGTRAVGMGRMWCDMGGPNDGTVALDETVVAGEAAHCVLDVSHTGMLVSTAVARQLAEWLGAAPGDAN